MLTITAASMCAAPTLTWHLLVTDSVGVSERYNYSAGGSSERPADNTECSSKECTAVKTRATARLVMRFGRTGCCGGASRSPTPSWAPSSTCCSGILGDTGALESRNPDGASGAKNCSAISTDAVVAT